MPIFPELRRTVKRMFEDKGEPLTLGLKDLVSRDSFFTSQLTTEALWYAQNGYNRIAEILMGGLPTWSGETVDINKALGHSVVWACTNLISKAIGFTPALLNQRTRNGKIEATSHPMYSAMLNAPNDEISAQGFSELLTSHTLNRGNGYAKIIRRSGTGTAIGLSPLLPENVDVDREKNTPAKRLVYAVKNETGAVDKTYTIIPGKPQDIFHIRGLSPDGVKGYDVIKVGRQSMGSAIANERHVATFWAAGGRLPYFLERPREFESQAKADEWRERWESRMSRPNTPPILTDGTKLHTVGASLRDSQGIENRIFTIAEICRWYSINPSLVGDASRATFNNHEQYMLQFVRMTLQDWYSRWENDFWRCVLTPEEKSAGYFLRHDIRTLLRGDFRTQMEGFAQGIQNGIFSQDDARDELDMNPLPDGAGSHYHMQVNMGTIGADGGIQAPKQMIRLDNPPPAN